MAGLIEKIGLFAAIILPLWNIPLIVKIIRRRSSKDISLAWALGVWFCILLMAPSGFQSADIVWRTFNIVNMIFFTVVMIVTVRFRHPSSPETPGTSPGAGYAGSRGTSDRNG